MLVQRLVNRIFQFLGIAGQRNELLWPPIDLAPLKIHDAAPQSLISGLLLRADNSCNYVQAAGVSGIAILVEHQLAHHFRYIFGMHQLGTIRRGLNMQDLRLGSLRLLRSNEPIV